MRQLKITSQLRHNLGDASLPQIVALHIYWNVSHNSSASMNFGHAKELWETVMAKLQKKPALLEACKAAAY